MLSVHPSLPVKTLKELLALARARPGHLQYASAGVGTFQHLSAEMMLADTQKRLASEGVETIATTPEQFGRHIAAEMAKWLKVTKDTNIKAE